MTAPVTNTVTQGYVYKFLTNKFASGLETEINKYAMCGWEPLSISADQGKPGRSDCGVYGCLMQKKYELLNEYQKAAIKNGQNIYEN
jgi:hypothetical protein